MVCVPLMSEYVEKMVGDMFEAQIEGADMVELRLDCLKHFQPKRDPRPRTRPHLACWIA